MKKLSCVIACLLVAPLAGAAPLLTDVLTQQAARSCGAGKALLLPETRQAAPILLYALPADQVPAGATVSVTLAAGGAAFLTESFAFAPESAALQQRRDDGTQLVFELLDAENGERAELLGLPEESRVTVEIAVDGRALRSSSLADFLAASDQTKQLGVLPRAVASPVVRLAESPRVYEIQPKFWVCGDNECNQGGIHPETCMSCPQDCAELCYCGDGYCGPGETCSSCESDCGAYWPRSLPNRQTSELVGMSWAGTQCFEDFYPPYNSYLYDEVVSQYKITTYSRVEECSGAVTESVISIQYVYQSCFHNWGISCVWGFRYMPPCLY